MCGGLFWFRGYGLVFRFCYRLGVLVFMVVLSYMSWFFLYFVYKEIEVWGGWVLSLY